MPVVLVLEDDAERLARFGTVAADLGVDLVSWPDAHRMIAEMGRFFRDTAFISLDHDLEVDPGAPDPGDGLAVAKHLATLAPFCPVVVHTSNGVRGDMMLGELELAGWKRVRVSPIGDDWIEADWFRVARRLLRGRRPAG